MNNQENQDRHAAAWDAYTAAKAAYAAAPAAPDENVTRTAGAAFRRRILGQAS